MSDRPNPTPQSGDDALVKSYNDVLYTSFPDSARHPDRLAAIGTLLGLDVAPVASSRVLELACGDGLNLIPIAATLPNATFVGFDYAARPVARAQGMARDLKLTNVQLLQLDLRELPADLGQFDYIVAHGLYSWIPEEVRAHVMPLIARHLAPKGVAFVSYNTLPGCHMRRAVWEMLKFHTRNIADMPGKVAAARSVLNMVATPIDNESVGQQAMRAEVRGAAEGTDAALAHDDMSEPNNPVYFHEFMADAASAGLAFLAEARLSTMMGGSLSPDVRQALRPLDRLAREQYLDFIHFRRFRESLLCHAHALSQYVVQPSRTLGMHILASLNMRRTAANDASARPPDADLDAIRSFLLARWPGTVPVAELAQWRQLNATSAGRAASRPTELLVAELYVAGLVDLRTVPVSAVAVPGERPEAFPAARWINREYEVIPNLYHEALRHQDPIGQKLLALLDGTRTREELMAALGGPFSGPSGRAQLDDVLTTLGSRALLVA
ncbi:MAG: class I SAM-dependent methyltransferase [Betaproteobacteria bacterium]